MKKNYIWLVTYTIAFAILMWGFIVWEGASRYTPVRPDPAPLNAFNYSQPVKRFPIGRYQALMDGRLFFEKVPVPVDEAKVVFSSRLVVVGLIKGEGGRAIVGLQEKPDETWVVKPGMTIQGEKIIRVGADYILVKNESGEGKVYLRK